MENELAGQESFLQQDGHLLLQKKVYNATRG